MPNWNKEQECYKDEKRTVLKVESGTGRTLKVQESWPREKPVLQKAYEQWHGEVYDEENQEYYPARDKKGNAIKGTNVARYLIKTIIRIKSKNGKEYLLSLGKLEGHDSLGNLKTRNCPTPEMWTRTVFGHEQIFDNKSKTMKSLVTGPASIETVYELPFNEKNLSKLLENREDDSINLCVKEETTQKIKDISTAGSYDDQVKLFKSKSFNFLFNAEYLTPQHKEEMRRDAEGQGLIPPRLYSQAQVEAGEVYRKPTTEPKNTYL